MLSSSLTILSSFVKIRTNNSLNKPIAILPLLSSCTELRFFWNKLNSNRYEPDTIKFLENRVGKDTILLDIGAANGAMTLFAASRGSQVVSYEPEEKIFSALASNLKLTPDVRELVELKKAGVSIKNETIRFGRGEDRNILSDIVIDDQNENREIIVEILSLSDELISLSRKGKKIIVKMDIEGAEWKILNGGIFRRRRCPNSYERDFKANSHRSHNCDW
jgi:FkbM family methyltransferase